MDHRSFIKWRVSDEELKAICNGVFGSRESNWKKGNHPRGGWKAHIVELERRNKKEKEGNEHRYRS